MKTDERTFHRDTSGSLSLKEFPLKELLKKENSSCRNMSMAIIFWVHLAGMVGLVIYVMTNDGGAISGVPRVRLVVFEIELFMVMMLTCITGAVFSVCWIWVIYIFSNHSIKITTVISHLIVGLPMILAILDYTADDSNFYEDEAIPDYNQETKDNVSKTVETYRLALAVILGLGLLIVDIWLCCKCKYFAFSEAMVKIATTCVSQNTSMLWFAYAVMPFQMIIYTFWLLGMGVCWGFTWHMAFSLLFLVSYNWCAWFAQMIVHSFGSVVTVFWALGMEGGDGKSRKLKASSTSMQGPIATSSLGLACLSIFRYLLLSDCPCCVKKLTKWFKNAIFRFQCVVSVVNIYDKTFSQANKTLKSLFKTTGISLVQWQSVWSAPLAVGTICSCEVCGYLGLLYQRFIFADSDIYADNDSGLYFLIYTILGGSVTAAGLAPIRSALITIFVVWADEPESFATGQPKLYAELQTAIAKSPAVKNKLIDKLLPSSPEVELQSNVNDTFLQNVMGTDL